VEWLKVWALSSNPSTTHTHTHRNNNNNKNSTPGSGKPFGLFCSWATANCGFTGEACLTL
jgi:hypothetical protein